MCVAKRAGLSAKEPHHSFNIILEYFLTALQNLDLNLAGSVQGGEIIFSMANSGIQVNKAGTKLEF